jgi:HAD superfamily hydrolase (TIGR01509 family)
MTLSLAGRPIQLLIFDMDGVLVSTSDCHARAYDELWQALGVQGPDYTLIAGRKTAEVVAEVTAALQPSPAQVGQWTAKKQQRARELIAATELCYADTRPCLKAFSDHGVPLAMGTAASAATVSAILERYALQEYFSAVVTADDIAQGKPAPDVYLRIIHDQGVAPEQVLVIEDSQAGLRAAVDAGAQAVSVRTGERIEHAAFLGTFPDLAALSDALEYRA